jgi:hypothetical protein
MKRKLISLILAFSIAGSVFALSGCSSDDKDDSRSEETEEEVEEEEEEETTTTTVAETSEEVTEETTTAIVAPSEEEPAVDVGFVHAEGLSDIYADLDNRSFVLNGHLITLGVTTFGEMFDMGFTFKNYDEERLAEEVGPASDADDDVHASLQIEGGAGISCDFMNLTDSTVTKRDCVLTHVNILLWGGDLDSTAGCDLQMAFPYGMTREELIANSGEPTEIDEELDRVDYMVDSTMFDGEDSGYKFFFENDVLCEVHIGYLP